jgi:co-chaperonin GroES (HSP10)
MRKIQAINDHVVAEEIIPKEETTESGLVIPLTVKLEPQKYGKVLSVGEKVENLKEGDEIIFHPNGGQAVIINGVILRILKNAEIYGIIGS